MINTPLVNILIPTYNRPIYFKRALESVLHQTYQNFEILISDDSDNEETKAIIQPYLYDNRIKYYFNPQITNAVDNWSFLQKHINEKAEYINWLMDDDMFLPLKLEYMLEIYEAYPEVTLVSSPRYFIDENDKIIRKVGLNGITGNSMVDGDNVGNIILTNNVNIIGELTTVLLKRKNLYNSTDIGWFGDSGKSVLSDVSTHLHMLTKGKFAYIDEPLSCLRIHDGQDQLRKETIINVHIWWLKLLRYAWMNDNFIHSDEEYCRLAEYYVKCNLERIDLYSDNIELLSLIEELAKFSIDVQMEVNFLKENGVCNEKSSFSYS